jgi:cytochrome c553
MVNFATVTEGQEGRGCSSCRKKSTGEEAIMKITKIAMLVLTIAVALFILIPNLSWAEDGAAIYKAKCAMCHGADGAGKPAAKIPSLVSEDAKKLSDSELEDFVANGGPSKKPSHAFATKGLSTEQIKAVTTEIRNLQKK